MIQYVTHSEPPWVTKTRGFMVMCIVFYFLIKRIHEAIADHKHFKRLKQKNDRVGELLKQFDHMRARGYHMPSLLDEAEELLQQVKARDST